MDSSDGSSKNSVDVNTHTAGRIKNVFKQWEKHENAIHYFA